MTRLLHPGRGTAVAVTVIPLEAEAVLSTSGQCVRRPCCVGTCLAPSTTSVALRLGGRQHEVPLCLAHARHWSPPPC
ncbi:MAG: hypothetical protein JWM64_1196 [Frankiales bacterium]|nr:hypothetical protein [Frankiales bacterium]